MESAVQRQRTNAEGLAKRCPDCGASNKSDAQWCGQCLTKFAAPEPVAPPPPPPPAPAAIPDQVATGVLHELAEVDTPLDPAKLSAVVAPETPPSFKGTGEAGAVRVDETGISWTCVRCETVNEFDVNLCVVCGTRFAESMRPPEEPKPVRDPNKVALISLFMPGAGHAYIGMWGEAIARSVISIWVVLVSLFAAAQSAPQARIMAVLFGVVATALWMLGAHDSYREASAMSGAVILKRKFFLYLVLALLLLSIVMTFSIVLGAR